MSSLRGTRVLLLEDEMLVCMDIEDMLLGLGCEVVGPAARVQQALEILGSTEVDVAILDVNLGPETSYPVAERLALMNVPFIFSTGHATLENGLEERPRLQKPFSCEQLVACLSQVTPAGRDANSCAPASSSVWR